MNDEKMTPFALVPDPRAFMFLKPRPGRGQRGGNRPMCSLANQNLYQQFQRKYQAYSGFAHVTLSYLETNNQQIPELTFNTPLYLTPLLPVVYQAPAVETYAGSDLIQGFSHSSRSTADFVSMIFSALFSKQYSVSNLNQLLNKNLSYSASPMELVMHSIASRVLRSSLTLDTYSPRQISQARVLVKQHSGFTSIFNTYNRQALTRSLSILNNINFQTLNRNLSTANFYNRPTIQRNTTLQTANLNTFLNRFNRFHGLTLNLLRSHNRSTIINHHLLNSLNSLNNFNRFYSHNNFNVIDSFNLPGIFNTLNLHNTLLTGKTLQHIRHTHNDSHPREFFLMPVNIEKEPETNIYHTNTSEIHNPFNLFNIRESLFNLPSPRYMQQIYTSVRRIVNYNSFQDVSQRNHFNKQSRPGHSLSVFPHSITNRILSRTIPYTSSPMEIMMNSIYTKTQQDNFKWTLKNYQQIRNLYPTFYNTDKHYHRDYNAIPQTSQVHQSQTWYGHLSTHKQFTSKDAGFVSNLFSALFTSNYRGSNMSWAFRKTLSYTASPMEIMMHGITRRVLEESYKTQETFRQQERGRYEKLQDRYRLQRFHLAPNYWITSRMTTADKEEPTALERIWGHVTNADGGGESVLKSKQSDYGTFPDLMHHSPNNNQMADDMVKQIQKKIVSETKQIQERLDKSFSSPAIVNNSNSNLSQITDGVYNKIVDRIKQERSARGY